MTYEYDLDSPVTDTFMLEVMGGISRGLRANDYDLLVVHVDPSDADWARRYLETGASTGSSCSPPRARNRTCERSSPPKAPLIVWGPPPGDHAYSTVYGDSFTGGKLATEHLLGVGRERIAFLGGPARDPEVTDRLPRLRDGAARGRHRSRPGAGRARRCGRRRRARRDAGMERLLEAAPDLDAVFANSDLIAIAALDALRAAGRSIPDDVAVVGYDDVALARLSNPPLTTIRQNGLLAGKLLAQNLIQHLQTGVVTDVSIPAERSCGSPHEFFSTPNATGCTEERSCRCTSHRVC